MESLITSLGPVLDASATGLRILTREKVEGEQTITLSDGDTEITLTGRVIWSKRRGLRQREIGFHFAEMSDAERQQFGRMIMQARKLRSIHRDTLE